jgi:tetratricopeptide (TPR) repeat protein
VVDRIGGLDTSYGLGNFEDDDFSLRAALAGFESWMAQDCFIHHFGHRTFMGANIDYDESLTNNWEIFKQKWGFPADLQLGSKYYWTQILKKKFAPEKLYCPLNQEDSKKIGRKVVLPPSPAADQLEEIHQKVQQLVHDGGREEAIVALEKLLEMAPEFAPAHNDLGVLYYNQGDKDKALDHYERAVRIEPQNSNFQKNLADFYFVESGRIEDALAVYNQVLELDAGDVEALMSIGLICDTMEKPEDAAYFYNRVLEVEPGNKDARQQLNNLFPN